MNSDRFLEPDLKLGVVRKLIDHVVAKGIDRTLAGNDRFTVDETESRTNDNATRGEGVQQSLAG